MDDIAAQNVSGVSKSRQDSLPSESRVRRPADRKAPPSLDPLDHNAGFLWLSPVLPMTKAEVDRFVALVKPVFARHRFDFELTLSMVTVRALCAITTISYNKDDAGEVDRAAGATTRSSKR